MGKSQIIPRHCTCRDNKYHICNCGCIEYEREISDLKGDVKDLRDALIEVLSSDNANKNVLCWCNNASSKCLTPGCLKARYLLQGLKNV